MSKDPNANKTSPSKSKSDREILELRIDVKLAEAKDALRFANQTELERIAREKFEPKYKRLLGLTSVAIALLIASLLWDWLGLSERIKEEAGKIIDQKLVDPQLKTTLDEALSKKAVPLRLVELAHQSKDMWTISRIGKKLKETTDIDFFPWNLQPLDQWWEINSSSYTNWPLSQFQAGFTALQTGKFDIALTNFESVLAIDSTADKSRALAIASAIEIGDIPKAQLINTNFALQGERWQRWRMLNLCWPQMAYNRRLKNLFR